MSVNKTKNTEREVRRTPFVILTLYQRIVKPSRERSLINLKEIIFNRTELKAAFCILHRAIERRDFHSTENHFRTHYVEKAQLDCYMIDFILHNRYLFIDKDTEWWRVAATALDERVFDGASCLARGIATVNQDDFHLTTTHDLDAFTFSRRGVNRLTFDLFENIMFNRDLYIIGKYYPSCDNLSGKFKITHKKLIDKIFNFIKGDSIMTDTTINNSATANTDSVSDTNTAQVQKVTDTSQADTQTISDTITSYDDITAQNADFVNTKFDSDSSYSDSIINTGTSLSGVDVDEEDKKDAPIQGSGSNYKSKTTLINETCASTTDTSQTDSTYIDDIPMSNADFNKLKDQPKNFIDDILTPSISDADISEIAALSNIRRKKLEIEINHFDLRKILPLDRQGKSFICPVCGNGSGHSGDGVSISEFEDDNDNPYFLYHCFKANDFDGRLTDILKKLNTTYDWYKVLAIGKKILSATPIYKPSTQIEPATVYSQEQLSMIKSDIKNFPLFLDDIPLADRRGLTIKTLQDFHIGFAKNWIHPKFRAKYEHYKGTPRIIIPTGDISYNAILINSARNADNLPYKSQNAGKKQLFNFDAVTTDQTNIIVEGEIDAMSIWQAGFKNVVAFGGTAKNAKKHAQKFISRLNEKFPNIKPCHFSFLIIFDNDSTGTAGAKSFVETLKKNGYPAVFRFLSTGTEKVDANDILMNDGDAALKAILENIIADAQVELNKLRDNLSTKNNVTDKNIDPPPPKVDSNSNDELERIKALPPSKDRDSQLIAAINDKLYLTPQRKRAHMQWVADSLQENADLIFSYDPVIDGLVAYDEFYRQYTFLKPVFWREGDCTGEQWKDSDDKELRRYLRKTYQNFKGAELIDDNLTHYSGINSFHPVKQYLESLQWDGVPRAETYFSKFLNIDDTEYSREITRKWLLGAISRIYHEGCDFQFALVLHGKQGIGKGYCLRMLGRKWHIVLTDSLDDSHALDSIERGWIVEIAELAAGRKAEINAQKVFLSENATTRRKAFARRAETTPRHCVFAISVNDEHFLRDLTGNRRYKIFESHSAQNEIVEGLTAEYVDQVWAEVFQMYQTLFKNGFNDQLLRMSREVDLQADEIAEKHLQDDGLQGEIAAFLDKPILPDFIWRWLNKDERRKFFVDEHIKFDEHELNYRIRANIKFKNKAQEMINQIDSYLRDASNNVYADTVQVLIAGQKSMRKQYTLYGNTTRNETCAAEIFNECFGNDKRKNTNRINEILSNLADWKRIETQAKNFAGVYGNQKNSYRRDKNAEKAHHTSTFAVRVSKIIDGSN